MLDDSAGGPGGPRARLETTAAKELRSALQEALTDPYLLPDGIDVAVEAPPPSGVGTYLLHRSPAFTLLCLVTSPRYRALAHDHGTWGLVGVYRGVEEEIRYLPVELPGSDGILGLAEVARRTHGPGGVMVVHPPPHDIHQVLNQGEKPSVTIHLLGADVVTSGFRTYAPAHVTSDTGPMTYDELPSVPPRAGTEGDAVPGARPGKAR